MRTARIAVLSLVTVIAACTATSDAPQMARTEAPPPPPAPPPPSEAGPAWWKRFITFRKAA